MNIWVQLLVKNRTKTLFVVLSFHVIELCFGKAASAELTQLFHRTQSLTVANFRGNQPLSDAMLDCECITAYNKYIHT